MKANICMKRMTAARVTRQEGAEALDLVIMKTQPKRPLRSVFSAALALALLLSPPMAARGRVVDRVRRGGRGTQKWCAFTGAPVGERLRLYQSLAPCRGS